jgi:hypothetical protein
MVSGVDIATGCTMLAVMLIGVRVVLCDIKVSPNRIARALEKQNHEEDAP